MNAQDRIENVYEEKQDKVSKLQIHLKTEEAHFFEENIGSSGNVIVDMQLQCLK